MDDPEGGIYVIPTYTGKISETIQEHITGLRGFVEASDEFNLDRSLRVSPTIIHTFL